MVKITAPLQSFTAHGTLRQQITFRRHAHGTIATRKPRHPVPIPSALRTNAILVRFLQRWKNIYGMILDFGWGVLAEQQGITRENAFIRFQIARYKTSQAFKSAPFYEYENPTPPTPALGAYVPEGSTTPFIHPAEAPNFDYLDLHRSEDPDFLCTHDNLITILSPNIEDALFYDRYDLHGTFYYRGRAWYIDGFASDASEPIYVTLD